MVLKTLGGEALGTSGAGHQWVFFGLGCCVRAGGFDLVTPFGTLVEGETVMIGLWSLVFLELSFAIRDMDRYQLWGEPLIADIAKFAKLNSRLALFLMGEKVMFCNCLLTSVTFSIHLGSLRTDFLCWVEFGAASGMGFKRFWVKFSVAEWALYLVLFCSMSWLRSLFLWLNFRNILLLFLLWLFSLENAFLTRFDMMLQRIRQERSST